MVVTTARATTKVARMTVAGTTRTMATMVTTMTTMTTMAAIAVMMMSNGDKHSNQILSRHQRRGTCW